MNIDRESLPLYLQVKITLKEEIENGKYPRGSLIPAEPQLEKIFHVSRITIRQAIAELEAEGYVKKARGKEQRSLTVLVSMKVPMRFAASQLKFWNVR